MRIDSSAPIPRSFLCVVIPGVPDPALTPNARVHYLAKAGVVAEARVEGHWETCAALTEETFLEVQALPTTTPIEVEVAVWWPKGRKRMDGDNLLASLKATCDGIASALEVDDARFRFAPVQQARGEGAGETIIRLRWERTSVKAAAMAR